MARTVEKVERAVSKIIKGFEASNIESLAPLETDLPEIPPTISWLALLTFVTDRNRIGARKVSRIIRLIEW